MSSCPAHDDAPRSSRLMDTLGAAGSFLCALHCASLPLLVALVPALGLTLLADHAFERGFVLVAAAFAAASLWLGYRRHRAFRALMFLLPGVAVLALGAFTPLHADPLPHAVLMSVGGTLVACAHLLNLRLSHGHLHDARCEH